MGSISNKTCICKLKPGDHIYSWRAAYVYSHHGIYIGNNMVIHYTTVISLPSPAPHPVDNPPCPTCGNQGRRGGVIRTCIDCFIGGGDLYLFKYGVSRAFFMASRGGSCTVAPSDPSEEVIHCASYLLENGFGEYHAFSNNCEDFAIYCKTGLCMDMGRSMVECPVTATLGMFPIVQGTHMYARTIALNFSVISVLFTLTRGPDGPLAKAPYLSILVFYVYCIVFGIYVYSVGRLSNDIGMHRDAKRVNVEQLVANFGHNPPEED